MRQQTEVTTYYTVHSTLNHRADQLHAECLQGHAEQQEGAGGMLLLLGVGELAWVPVDGLGRSLSGEKVAFPKCPACNSRTCACV